MGAPDLRSQKLKLTDHAVDRYHARWGSHLTRGAAEVELQSLIAQSAPLRLRTCRKGHEVWAAGEIRFVVKRDAGENIPVIVTVLPAARPTHEEQDLALYDEWIEDQQAKQALDDQREKDAQLARSELEIAMRDKADAEALSAAARDWLAEVNRRIVSAKDRISWHKRNSTQVRT